MTTTTLPHETGDLFRLAVELSPSGMLAVDAAGTILLVNREIERLFGYGRDELAGRTIELLVPGRFRGRHPDLRGQFHSQPEARPMGAGRELFGRRKDGTEFPVEIGLNPVRTELGLLVFASVVDVTQRQQLEEQLRQSQKLEAIGTIAGGIAHDFNNLLLSIVGHAELARGSAAEPRLQEDLDQILKAAQRGRELVLRVLTFSRQHVTRRVPLQLERPLRDALGLLHASLPSSIEIREAFDPRMPPVRSDETEVHQILMNLATNSAHALEGGGRIDVTLAPFVMDAGSAPHHPDLKPGLYARLTVVDNGRGMRPEVAQRAFEPFFTTKPPGSGTGLGLSVIRGIVRSHGGVVELWTKPGEGTKVDVYLPALEAEEESRRTAGNESGDRPEGHVLLVDDEEILAGMQRRRLEDLGCRVTVHTSSAEALEDFRARPAEFDLLITDNTMPGLTGSALAQEIHRLRPSLPILMVSGLLETDDLVTLRARGITGVLRKPHSAGELGEAVREALRSKG
jgi:hypothetical protein